MILLKLISSSLNDKVEIMFGCEHAQKDVWKEHSFRNRVLAHTCGGHAIVLFILGEEPSQNQIEAGGLSDGGIGLITKQMWWWWWRRAPRGVGGSVGVLDPASQPLAPRQRDTRSLFHRTSCHPP